MPKDLQVTGVVTKYEIKNDWHKFTVEGLGLETKYDNLVNGLREGMRITADYTESEGALNMRTGKPFVNRMLQSWEPAGDPASEPSSVVASDPWPGKDRATAMESAYKSAATFMQALVGAEACTSENLIKLAHRIYNDIEQAREGVEF